MAYDNDNIFAKILRNEIPADVDLSDYQSVVIYCVPFHVVFATATLG